ADLAQAEIDAILADQAAVNSELATAVATLTSEPAEGVSFFSPFDILFPANRALAQDDATDEPTEEATEFVPTQETLPTADPGFAATLIAGATQTALQDRAALIADAILAAEEDDPENAEAVATALTGAFATQAAYATLQIAMTEEVSASQTAVAE